MNFLPLYKGKEIAYRIILIFQKHLKTLYQLDALNDEFEGLKSDRFLQHIN